MVAGGLWEFGDLVIGRLRSFFLLFSFLFLFFFGEVGGKRVDGEKDCD